ncbi:MAG: hypothetical protein KDD89_03715 [Anaerolineales bacterium]|nr:hypothetical protein [Anaerolineales bacterium]
MSRQTIQTIVIVGILLTLLGLVGGVYGALTAVGGSSSIIFDPGESQDTPSDLLPENGQVIIIERDSGALEATFLLPLLFTAVGSFISFGSLWLNWRREERQSEQDLLELELLRVELALKRQQLAQQQAQPATPNTPPTPPAQSPLQ